MDKRLFSNKSPGILVEQIIYEKPDYAFIPDPLPPKWSIDTYLWPLIAEAKEKIGILEGIGRNLPNPDILLTPLAKTEAIKSSSIEGTYASPLEYLMYELNPKKAKSEDSKINDWRQVINYSDSLSYGIEKAKEINSINCFLIRNMHKLLLREVRGKNRHPGEWRPDIVMIGFPPRFVPPPKNHLNLCLDQLEAYINSSDDLDYLIRSFLIHYQFETIHPFSDGNGRIGRLLLTLTIFLWSPMTKPWLFMSNFFEKNRDEYINRLFNVSAQGKWTEWIDFCLRGTIFTAEETIRKVEMLRQLQIKLHDRVRNKGGNLRLSIIVDRLFTSPFIEAPEAAKITNVSIPTARKDLKTLIDCEILRPLSGNKPVIYYSPEIFSTSYEDIENLM